MAELGLLRRMGLEVQGDQELVVGQEAGSRSERNTRGGFTAHCLQRNLSNCTPRLLGPTWRGRGVSTALHLTFPFPFEENRRLRVGKERRRGDRVRA